MRSGVVGNRDGEPERASLNLPASVTFPTDQYQSQGTSLLTATALKSSGDFHCMKRNPLVPRPWIYFLPWEVAYFFP